MNITTTEVRLAVTNDIGARLDDTLTSVEKEVSQWEGANAALVQSQKVIEDLAAHVDKDMDEGQYDIETAKVAKKYITRAASVVASLAQQASNRNMMSRGKVEAMQQAVGLLKEMHATERKRLEAFKQAVASGTIRIEDDGTAEAVVPGLHISGVRPGMSLKEQRLAEEAAEDAAAAAAPPPSSAVIEPASETQAQSDLNEALEAASAMDEAISSKVEVAPPLPPVKKTGGRGKRADNP